MIRALSFPFIISFSLLLLLNACGVGEKGRNIDIVTIEKIKIYAKTSEYIIGDTDALTAEVQNSDGSRYNANSVISWKSSNTDILTVSNAGELHTYKEGEVTISAILDDHIGELIVSVRPDPETLSVYPVLGVDNIIQGQTIKINAMEKQSYGLSRILETGDGHTWSSSDDSIATIDSNGVINALGYGDIEISVSYKEFTGSAKLKILPKLISFSLENEEITVSTGKRAKIISRGVFADDTEGEVNQRLTWASEDRNMLTVDDLGVVTPIRTGTTKVLVRYKDHEEIHSATVNIRSSVYPKAINNNSITIAWNDMRAKNYRLYWSNNPGVQKGDADVYTRETTENEITIANYPNGRPLAIGQNYYFRLEVIYDLDGLIGEEVAIYLPEEVAQKPIAFTYDWKYATSHMIGDNIYFFGGVKDNAEPIVISSSTTVFRNTRTGSQHLSTQMPRERFGHASCQHRDNDGIVRIYVFGGYTDQDGVTQLDDSIDIFNTYSEAWDILSPQTTMTSARAFHSCVTIGDRIYLLGGEIASSVPNDVTSVPTDVVEVFVLNGPGADKPLISRDTETTLKLPPLSIPRSHFAAASIGDNIYIGGGLIKNTDTIDITNSVEVLNPLSDTPAWSTATALPEPAKLFQLHNINNRLYAAGGINSNEKPFDRILRLDGDWLEDSVIPDARLNVRTIVDNNTIYFFGGTLDGNASIEGQIYTINDKAWYPRKSPAQARVRYSHAQINNEIYFFGGIHAKDGTLLSSIEKYDLELDHWKTLDETLPSVRAGAAAASLNGKIYIIGGVTNKSEILKRVDIFDPQTNSWSEAENLPSQRYGHSASVYNNKIYVVGGIDYQLKEAPEPINSEETPETIDINMPVYVYDSSTNKWESLDIPTHQDNGFFGNVEILNDYLYYLGGKVDNGYTPNIVNRQLYRLDLLRNEWLPPLRLDNGRAYADTAIRNQSIYIVAGETNTLRPEINRFNVKANAWSNFENLREGCTNPASYNYREKLLVIGCIDRNGEIRATEVFR